MSYAAPSSLHVDASHPVPAGGAATPVETLWSSMVRRIAWSGDATRATVVLEMSSGALAGATVLIHSCAGRVSVRLVAPPEADLGDWRARIATRLAARGLDVESVD